MSVGIGPTIPGVESQLSTGCEQQVVSFGRVDIFDRGARESWEGEGDGLMQSTGGTGVDQHLVGRCVDMGPCSIVGEIVRKDSAAST